MSEIAPLIESPQDTARLYREHRRRNLGREIFRYRHYYVLLIPAVVSFVLVNYVPMGGVVLAFKRYNVTGGIFGSPWVGLKYFDRMLRSPDFVQIFFNTLEISLVKLVIAFPAPIVFSLLLNEVRLMAFKRTFQTISYLPHFVSWVVAAGLIRAFLRLEGPLNFVLGFAGAAPRLWLTFPELFVPILVVSEIWKNVGWGSIIYLAAITSIDPQLYEAAQIDGATRLQRMLRITLPSISHVIVILFLLRVGHILNAGFDQIFNLYNPLVYRVGDIIDTYVYRIGIEGAQYSYTTAIGLTKNVIGVVLLLITNQVTRRIGGRGTL